ncbi:MAG: DEAD/DEAH box helicase, partial [Kangiellaceae bacterium]|nr:DEAD/DEAH box helicase [Kangiellaceae bacterium]
MNHTSQNSIKPANKAREKSENKEPSRQDFSIKANKKSNRRIARSDSQIVSDILRFKKIQLNKELPIAEKAAEIQKLLAEHQVLIVAGKTGCGKTTQLPQICLQAGLGIKKQIAHTQPRRVAATSVANRIASELKTELGNEVGYAVRFSDRTSENTRIKLMTDGVLLAELQSDPLLRRYEVIIIDEAHERSLNIDFLLGFLKQLLNKRKDLKLIVTSATIDPVKFSKYFNNAPMIKVEGRTFPVEVVYQPRCVDGDEPESLEESVVKAIDCCIAQSTGDILIFSHGEAEIRQLSKFIQKQNYPQLIVLPLYARLGINEQQAIFSSSNKRKIIIATNVAETSLTIPNILFVIDIGLARISRYSQRNKIQQLPIEKISQASADQRKGRSGRIAPGICIRLYDKEDFDNRTEYTEPEIKRTNLSSVVLRLKALGVPNVEDFPFIQMPNERQWKVAFNLLFEIGGMDEDKQITAIGQQMSRLPLDPQLSRILLDSNNQAFEEMLIVTSFLG